MEHAIPPNAGTPRPLIGVNMAGRPKQLQVDERFSMTVAELVRLIAALPKNRREALARELERQALLGRRGGA